MPFASTTTATARTGRFTNFNTTTNRTAGTTSVLGRGSLAPLRSLTVDQRIRFRQMEINRAQRVLQSSRSSADARRTAGVTASRGYRAIGLALERRGDRTGAARAFSNAAASRWGRNDRDNRFRSESWARAGRLLLGVRDLRGSAEALRRAAEALDRSGTEQDQLAAAALYREEAGVHAQAGDHRARADALVSSSEAFRRAGHIVTASHQAFDRGAPSTWPESEHVLRARAHDHYTSAGTAHTEARQGYRDAGLSRWAARSASNTPRSQLPEAQVQAE